jgi:hypothetical protein
MCCIDRFLWKWIVDSFSPGGRMLGGFKAALKQYSSHLRALNFIPTVGTFQDGILVIENKCQLSMKLVMAISS